MWIDIFDWMGDFFYGLIFWKWSLKCLLWNLCRAWVDFLCVFKFCRNCDFKSQTPHENGARGKTIQRKYQFNYTFILVTFTVLKYTYAHMCKANERKALTLPTYNISSKKSRQQICHVDEQASTYTHSHTHDFWQKLFLAIQTECYIVLETK